MSSIFLSHNHNDKPFVRRLADSLRAQGVRVWVDEAEIGVGDSLIEKIENAIDDMEYVGVVLSPESVDSQWVKREVRQALTDEIANRRVKVLPILFNNCKIPGFLRDKLYADFRPGADFDVGVQALVRRVLSTDPDAAETSSGGWSAKGVRLGFQFGVLEEEDSRPVFGPHFVDALHSVAEEQFSKDPLEFLASRVALLTARSMLRTHPGGNVLESDMDALLGELAPKTLDYMLDLACRYRLIATRGDTYQIAQDFREEIEATVTRDPGHPVTTKSELASLIADLCRYRILTVNGGETRHRFMAASLVWYMLEGLGVVSAFE
jgi:hypothetical protein